MFEKEQNSSSQDYWRQITVCSVGDAGANPLLKPGEQVWLKSSELIRSKASVSNPAAVPEQCLTTDSSRPEIKESPNSLTVEESLIPSQPSVQPKPGN